MEGCAPSLIIGTKKNEVLTESEPMELFSLSPVLEILMVLEDLIIPLVELSSLRVATSSFYLSLSLISCWEARITSREN
jgi:hypothetical protein